MFEGGQVFSRSHFEVWHFPEGGSVTALHSFKKINIWLSMAYVKYVFSSRGFWVWTVRSYATYSYFPSSSSSSSSFLKFTGKKNQTFLCIKCLKVGLLARKKHTQAKISHNQGTRSAYERWTRHQPCHWRVHMCACLNHWRVTTGVVRLSECKAKCLFQHSCFHFVKAFCFVF